MPAPAPTLSTPTADKLCTLGQQIRSHRKSLRISATTVAEAAGLSRVTLHRIEHGAPSVTMAAYMNVIAALGLGLNIATPTDRAASVPEVDRQGWIPARIRLADYPQLKQLAWQVHGTDTLTPLEALGIYERQWRHLDVSALQLHEQQLIDALRLGLG